jgi:general secretion pathway protein D
VLGLLLAVLLAPVVQAQEGEGVSRAEDGWTVNIRNADIQAFINQVAEMTGRNFVVDPRVRARDVTVVSHEPLSRDQVYELFLSVLQVHGYAAVPTAGATKIVPNTNAKQSNLPLTQQGEDGKRGEELITRVIPLDNAPAEQLVPVLRPLVPQYGHLAAVGSANALIISDHVSNVQRIEAIIAHIDGADSDQVEIIELEHAFAGNMVELLKDMTSRAQSGGRGNQSGKLMLVADERTNSLIIKGDQSARDRLRRLVRELDVPQDESGSVQVIRLSHADAESTAELLKGFADSAQAAKGQDGGGSGGSNQDVSIQADKSLNALVIRAEPGLMKELRTVINQLDVRRAQLLIEAAIVEISGDKGLDLGFQYAAGDEEKGVAGVNFSNFGISVNQIIAALRSDEAPQSGLSDGITVGGGERDESGGLQWGGFVQALASTSKVNLLSTPSLLTLNNQEASIIVGQNVPFVTGTSTNTGSGVSNPFQTIQREDVGLTLKVTPHLAGDDSIRLELEQETSDVQSGADVQASDLITTKREIKTTVLAEDRQTIVLGGLMRDSMNKTVRKVPLLGDIPLLGYLFRSTSTSREKQNLMMFLRPTILVDGERLVELTRRKYLGISSLQFRVNDRGELERLVDEPLPANPNELFQGREGFPESMRERLEDELGPDAADEAGGTEEQDDSPDDQGKD